MSSWTTGRHLYVLTAALHATALHAVVLALCANPCLAAILPEERPVLLTAEETATVLETVRRQWGSARAQIQTAVLTYHTSNGPFQKPLNSSIEAIPLLDEYGIQQQPRNMALLTEWLNREGPSYREERFHPCTMHVEGQRLRTDHLTNFLHAVDADHHYFFNRSSREVLLSRRGQSRISVDHPQLIRQIPDPRSADEFVEVWRFPQAGLLQLNYQRSEGKTTSFALIHESNGLPHVLRIYDQAGRPSQDRVLLNYVTYPGDVEFPSVSLGFRYRNDLITSYSLFLIDSAEFNVPVRESDLAFGVPAGVHIRDERNPDQIQSVTLTEPVPDVAEYVDRALDFANPPVAAGPVQTVATRPVADSMLWINGAALMVVGLLLWRRRPANQGIAEEPRIQQ